MLFLLCDEQVFVKKYEVLDEIASEYEGFFALGFPFVGAREHYILDIENLIYQHQSQKTRIQHQTKNST